MTSDERQMDAHAAAHWEVQPERLAESNADPVRLLYDEIIAAPQQRITFARLCSRYPHTRSMATPQPRSRG